MPLYLESLPVPGLTTYTSLYRIFAALNQNPMHINTLSLVRCSSKRITFVPNLIYGLFIILNCSNCYKFWRYSHVHSFSGCSFNIDIKLSKRPQQLDWNVDRSVKFRHFPQGSTIRNQSTLQVFSGPATSWYELRNILLWLFFFLDVAYSPEFTILIGGQFSCFGWSCSPPKLFVYLHTHTQSHCLC